jgi:hypothetical protein
MVRAAPTAAGNGKGLDAGCRISIKEQLAHAANSPERRWVLRWNIIQHIRDFPHDEIVAAAAELLA